MSGICPFLSQKVLFVSGKGGTGRTSLSAGVALAHARRGLRTLLVQWSLQDAAAAAFGTQPAGHRAATLAPNLEVMNYAFDEALREYFVSHLGLTSLFEVVLGNTHVRKLLNAAPGLPELFFLGRIFWLAELALEDRGWQYDRIVVDAPASGHGIGLFGLARGVAAMGIAGPLASESERVARFLDDTSKVAVVLTALPEELPAAECLEGIGLLRSLRGVPPQGVVINRAVSAKLWSPQVQDSLRECESLLQVTALRQHVSGIGGLLGQRQALQERLRTDVLAQGVPCFFIPEFLGDTDQAENVPARFAREIEFLMEGTPS